LLSTLDDDAYRESALINAAHSRAITGDLPGARGFADSIQTPRGPAPKLGKASTMCVRIRCRGSQFFGPLWAIRNRP
jgi:hypothetical protein